MLRAASATARVLPSGEKASAVPLPAEWNMKYIRPLGGSNEVAVALFPRPSPSMAAATLLPSGEKTTEAAPMVFRQSGLPVAGSHATSALSLPVEEATIALPSGEKATQ